MTKHRPPQELPSPEELRRLLIYEPDTGHLIWQPRDPALAKNLGEGQRWNSRYAGKRAATALDGKGYHRAQIQGHMLYAHRIAWAMHYGCWPEGEIDHMNGDPRDNRISNLRAVSKSQNMRNRKLHFRNKSGVSGVKRHKRLGSWVVTIAGDKQNDYLGSFVCFVQAVRARREAEVKHNYHPNHGRC